MLHQDHSFPCKVEQHTHGWSHLVVDVGLGDQNVGNVELVDITMPLKLLSYTGAEGGDGERDGVHGLDLGSLITVLKSVFRPLPSIAGRHTARCHAR